MIMSHNYIWMKLIIHGLLSTLVMSVCKGLWSPMQGITYKVMIGIPISNTIWLGIAISRCQNRSWYGYVRTMFYGNFWCNCTNNTLYIPSQTHTQEMFSIFHRVFQAPGWWILRTTGLVMQKGVETLTTFSKTFTVGILATELILPSPKCKLP